MSALVSLAACLLLGQAAPHASAASPPGTPMPPPGASRSAESASSRESDASGAVGATGSSAAPASSDWAAMVAESTALAAELFQPPAATDASVRAVRLSEIVAVSRGADQRATAVRAYWLLASASARLAATQRELEKLEQLADATGRKPDAQAASALAAAISNATQARSEAESQLVQARRDVSRRMGFDNRTTPVAIDAPHAGTYHTRFTNIYSGAAPPQAVVLHRTIQLRGEAMFAHAAATKATSRLADADLTAFSDGRTTWQAALSGVVEQGRRRRAFIDAVYAYNRDIAEYALPIAKPDASTATLVGMLIKTDAATATRAGSPAKSASRSTSAPAGEPHSSATGARR